MSVNEQVSQVKENSQVDNKYEDIKNFKVEEEWEKLNWVSLPKNDKNFVWGSLENKAGLYRVKLQEKHELKGCFCVGEQNISISKLEKDAILSIGKTKNLKRRLSKDHFSGNCHGNRLGRHLAKIFSDKECLSLKDVFDLDKITIEYVVVDCWWKRDLLESYGKIHHRSLFDLGIEH